MRERTPSQRDPATARPAQPRGAVGAGAAARALALQRVAGNRAAGRVLTRWAKHPDAEKKGVMVPDSAATEYERFNPPQNA